MSSSNQGSGFTGPVEFIPGFKPRRRFSCVVFDFDGTLSLLRAGWTDIMLQMCLDFIPTVSSEAPVELRALLLDDILRLNGKPTIHQMVQFSERVRERGGKAGSGAFYKEEYLRRLDQVVSGRKRKALERGTSDVYEVAGATRFLEHLNGLGFTLVLASGTDERFVLEELELLGLTKFFGRHIYAAPGDEKPFSKRDVMQRVLHEHNFDPAEMLSFGDGHVETETATSLGGLAIAVASDENQPGSGRIDVWKRDRLLKAGAQVVIPDYRDAVQLLPALTQT